MTIRCHDELHFWVVEGEGDGDGDGRKEGGGGRKEGRVKRHDAQTRLK